MFLCVSCFSGLYVSVGMLGGNYCFFLDWEVISLNGARVEMALIVDWISVIFLSFVSFIAAIVLFYSGGYMAGDYNSTRFIYLVLCFVFSIFLLIISPNLISILLGWDGLGLVSYVLVIYYQNERSASAGILTALSNRIGDVAILLSIALISGLGGWNYIFYTGVRHMELAVPLLILAAITKRAQIPFSAWLPAAMAAPTPVSALVHSSTLVTAGVYLMIRFRPVLVGITTNFLLLIGCITIFIAGLGANFETDLKKIIALSTLSQLGVIIGSIGLGFSNLAFFHLLTHALFKALLFICAGSFIHRMGDNQDIRRIGGLVNHMPLSSRIFNVANLSLCGFPFLAGFYSKDLILELVFLNPLNEACFYLYAFSTGLTVCYTFRVSYCVIRGNYNTLGLARVDDEKSLTAPIFGLWLGAVCSGSTLSWLIFPSPYIVCLPLGMKVVPLLVSLLGAIAGYGAKLINRGASFVPFKWYSRYSFSGSMWFIPFLSTRGVRMGPLKRGFIIMSAREIGWLEHFGGQGIFSKLIRRRWYNFVFQENSVKKYLFIFLALLLVYCIIYCSVEVTMKVEYTLEL